MRKHKPICDWLLLALLLSSSWSLSGQAISNAGRITIEDGGSVSHEGDFLFENSGHIILDGELSLKGDFINNSNSNVTDGMGTIIFSSTSGEQSIRGNTGSRFYDLEQNNPEGLILNQHIYVAGNLKLNSGGIDLNGNTLDLDETGEIVDEEDSRRIHGTTGRITAYRNLNAPFDEYDIAGIGIGVKINANLGPTEIERTHGVKNIGDGVSIERSFRLLPASDSPVEALYFDYLTSELNGQESNSLLQWFNAHGTSNWIPGIPHDSGDGFVDGGPYNSIKGRWTLSSAQVTSTSEQLPELAFRLFPNPITNEDLLRIESLETGEYELQLTSMTGQLLWQHTANVHFAEDTQEYQLPDLPDGVYTLQIISDKYAPASQNIIIQSN